MLSEAQIADLRGRVSIEQIVGEMGVSLRKHGKRLAGPCPLCGGRATAVRFEIVRAAGDAAFVCAACGQGGDVIKLVQLYHNCSFREAVERLGGAQAVDPEIAARREREQAERKARQEAEAEAFRQAERRRCLEIWRGSLPVPGSPVEAYLRARAIRDIGAMRIRFVPDLPYFHGETVDERGRKSPNVIHRGPAMLAPIVAPDAPFAGLHITWIDPARPGKKIALFDAGGEELPAKKMRGRKQGGYLDVFPGGDARRVYLGEGIETVASAREARRDEAVYRVAGDLGNLAGRAIATVAHPTLKDKGGRPRRVPGMIPDFDSEACPIPDVCADLLLLKDGDSENVLTELAMWRAAARHKRAGRRISVADAPEGMDFNDMARG